MQPYPNSEPSRPPERGNSAALLVAAIVVAMVIFAIVGRALFRPQPVSGTRLELGGATAVDLVMQDAKNLIAPFGSATEFPRGQRLVLFFYPDPAPLFQVESLMRT